MVIKLPKCATVLKPKVHPLARSEEGQETACNGDILHVKRRVQQDAHDSRGDQSEGQLGQAEHPGVPGTDHN